MNEEPLIHWPDPLIELLGFVAAFLAAGAVGLRFAALRGLLAHADAGMRALALATARRAAFLGLFGVVLRAILIFQRLGDMAAQRETTILALVTTQAPIALQVYFTALALLGFLLAAFGVGYGWWLGALGVVAYHARNALLGRFDRLGNPMHELGGGFWIGTLFLLVVCGLVPLLRSQLSSAQRGEFALRMVNSFSPFALFAAGLLGFFGLNTAWQHLKRLDALWTTPYGWTLCAKLVVVAGVIALGAWNWRRQKPRMGSEAGAVALRRSATAELLVAGVVLLITSVLASLPSPR